MKLPVLYPILDIALLDSRGCRLEEAAAAMIDGGARILQIRGKGQWTRHRFDQASRVARLCSGRGVPLIINDRADIALMLGAGLHVGQDDLPPGDARRLLGDGPLVGYSTHSADQLIAATGEPVNYLALGPMFPTQSKLNPDPVVGLDRLRAWRRLTARPLVAIGGVTRENARSTLEAGADSVAVIGDLLPANCSAGSIRERMQDWQRTIVRHE